MTIMAKISTVKILFLVILLNIEVGKGGAELNSHKRQKRHLDWSSYTLRSSDTSGKNPDLHIRRYKPHPKTEQVKQDEDYTAFTLYQGDTGTFHFVTEKTAYEHSANCNNPNTRHAGAYHYIYGLCPELEKNLIASGFCFRNEKLGFDSYTFNEKGKSYMNNAYYKNKDKFVNPSEQTYLTNCYIAWKKAGFPVDSSWSCAPSSRPPSAPLAGGVALSNEERCGADGIWLSMYLVTVTTVFHSLLVRW